MSDTPKDTIKVAAIPLDIVWADPARNIENATRLISALEAGTDIAVLPELFTTAFMADTDAMRAVAETSDGATVTWARALAAKRDMAIAGSFLCTDNGRYFNRGFFVKPDGETVFYDKHHLFCLSPEAKVYAHGGDTVPVVSFRGWNIALIICYDLRFPVWCRNRKHGYDMLLVAANWPHARGFAWTQLLSARAIENQVPVVGANRSGRDDYGNYDGLTLIVDAMGRTVVSTTTEKPMEPVTAVFSRESLARFRRQLPVGSDADDFELIPSPAGPTSC